MDRNEGNTGTVFLVGAGPGDPGLITVRGMRLLERADVIVYDHLAGRKLLRHAPEDALLIYVGKRGDEGHSAQQDEINALLVEHARAGRKVVRLKGGDPLLFGRGGEEIEELVLQNIPFEVVPGVTAATAAAAFAGIPLTHREHSSSVVFLTGHESAADGSSHVDWEKLATGAATIVIYMGVTNLSALAEKLIHFGRAASTPAAVIRQVSTSEQQTITAPLSEISSVVAGKGIRPPALVVVGDVVNLRASMQWYEKRPLFGRRIMVTRTREQAPHLVAELEEFGADCFECPAIAIESVELDAVAESELERLGEYHWILFSSINAVEYFFTTLRSKGMDARDLNGPQIAAIGKATERHLWNYGIIADLVPDAFTSEGLAESMLDQGIEGRNILIPRAEKAREVLPETLRGAGAQVSVLPVYRNIPQAGPGEDIRRMLADGKIDMITFTSSSTVRNFFTMLDLPDTETLQNILEDVALAAIGPATAKVITDSGLQVNVMAEEHTTPGLVTGIVDYYNS